MANRDALDPKELISESYKIAGITASECRSIFLDWALGVPAGADATDQIKALLERHAGEPRDHPMTVTLIAALVPIGPARRRGGRSGRID